VDDDIVWMGADSAFSAEHTFGVTIRKDPKIFLVSECYLIGICGSARMGQLLRYAFMPPVQPTGMDDLEYMCTLFVDAARDCLRIGGMLEVARNVDRAVDSAFMVAYKGNIYTVDDDFDCGIPADPYAAIGCGEHLALGAMFATATFDVAPKERLLSALKASERFSNGVRAPFVIKSL
jgi:hypothetical protein